VLQWLKPLLLVSVVGCELGTAQVAHPEPGACVETAIGVQLPAVLDESSGAAVGRRDPSVVWTHNDSGDDPVLYAVDHSGELVGSMRVDGANAVDWEDMEISACEGGTCLYLADIGDNAEQRSEIVVYRIPEPDPGTLESSNATAYSMAYPDGPRDAEAIFVLPGEQLFVVSKGRSDRIALYRYPGPLNAAASVVLEHVQDLAGDQRPSLDRQVTGASASPDGRVVAVRTYTNLAFYAVDGTRLAGEPIHAQSLRTLQERQGEAVAMGPDDMVVLTTEAAAGNAAAMSMIRCQLDD